MTGWDERLPIRHRLMAAALAVTTAAVIVAVAGLVALDLWRYRAAALDETNVLASVMAENSAAAVVFRDPDEARRILSTAGARSSVTRACLYTANGSLFADFTRSSDRGCPREQAPQPTWRSVIASATVARNQRPLGVVYIERELAELWTTVVVVCSAGLVMLVIAGIVAIPIANHLHRRIAGAIEELSAAASVVGAGGGPHQLSHVDTGVREISQLVAAFSDMLQRVADATDALRRKEAEREALLAREREASRLKDEFLAAVSHELRTPLAAIVGWADALSIGTPDEQTLRKGIASISRNAKAQAHMIEDLVDVSRIIAGKFRLRKVPVDLRELIERAVETIRVTAQAKRILVRVALPDPGSLTSADPDRLQQVLGNLLSNAVKFNKDGGSIDVTARALAGTYEIAVTDTGIGIPADFLPHVFDRFRQADATTTKRHGGLGLGLAIVKEITTLHGGTVSVESAGDGHGSTFRVALPALVQPASPPPSADAGSIEGRPLAGIQVLAVDDNADALEVLQISLPAVGATVVTASSGSSAIALLATLTPDVILCDLAMPGMDGFAFVERLHELPRGRSIPVLAVSAHVTAEYRTRSREAGFFEHIAKPYQREPLVRAIASALRARAGSLSDDRTPARPVEPGSGSEGPVA